MRSMLRPLATLAIVAAGLLSMSLVSRRRKS